MDEITRFSLALSELGFVHKGKFKREDHDFSLDNYAPMDDCCVVITMDSIKVLNCSLLEYWEAPDDDFFADDNLLENTINTLNKLQHV
jgi:hypothetical protein